jgi:hypothetical protein
MRSPFRRIGTCIGFAGILLAAASVAAPLAPTASRPEIRRWFAAVNVDAAAPQRWTYSFAAADGRMLEALSVALVRDGYEIVTLAGGAALTRRGHLRVKSTPLRNSFSKRSRSRLFSAQMYSCTRVPSRSIRLDFSIHGAVSTFGSSIVTS